MNIKKSLLDEHSVQNTMKIVDYLIENPNKVDDLIKIILENEELFAQRAIWVFAKLYRKDKRPLKNKIFKVVPLLYVKTHNALKRGILDVLQREHIPPKHQGRIFDFCLNQVEAVNAPTAIRAISLTILYNISNDELDLKSEIKAIIEMYLNTGTTGFKNRAEKILFKLQKELGNIKKP